MSFSRRFFMAGLAAVLSVFRVPGISASETDDTPEFVYDVHEFRPFIDYFEVGEGEEILRRTGHTEFRARLEFDVAPGAVEFLS